VVTVVVVPVVDVVAPVVPELDVEVVVPAVVVTATGTQWPEALFPLRVATSRKCAVEEIPNSVKDAVSPTLMTTP
jgi:hypothetical protein